MKSRVITAFAALFAFAVTGCSDGGSGGNGSGDGGGDAVAWADSVCTSIKDDFDAISTQPDLNQSDPQAAKDSLVTYLGTLETSLDGMASAIEEAGTPPVNDGEAAVNSFVDEVGTAKEAVTSAKTKIDGASVDDPAGFQQAVVSAVEDLQSLSKINPTSSFEKNPELNKAYTEAAACKELDKAVS